MMMVTYKCKRSESRLPLPGLPLTNVNAVNPDSHSQTYPVQLQATNPTRACIQHNWTGRTLCVLYDYCTSLLRNCILHVATSPTHSVKRESTRTQNSEVLTHLCLIIASIASFANTLQLWSCIPAPPIAGYPRMRSASCASRWATSEACCVLTSSMICSLKTYFTSCS